MSQNFMARAALFASPVDSADVPKKKVAREKPLPPAPVFLQEEDEKSVVEAPRASGVPEDVVEEPMDVDGSFLPSPQKATPQRKSITVAAEKTAVFASSPSLEAPECEAEANGTIPCQKSTTPRRKSSRKSMPTPGKRLFFTSKDTENDERQADESTKLELLMAQSPDEIPEAVKNLVKDQKEMFIYGRQVKQEISDITACKTTREALLRQASETVSTAHLSSNIIVPITPLDLSTRKEEAPSDIAKRLYGSFLAITEEGGELRKAKREYEAAKEENDVLKHQLSALEEVSKEMEEADDAHIANVTKLSDELEQLDEGFAKLEQLQAQLAKPMRSFSFIPF